MIRVSTLCVCLVMALCATSTLLAQDGPPSGEAAPPGQATPERPVDPRAKDRQQAVLVGTLLLSLIIVTGLSLLGIVILLGRRTRRLAQKPLPQTTPVDELWFLKKSRPPPEDPENGEAVNS